MTYASTTESPVPITVKSAAGTAAPSLFALGGAVVALIAAS